MTFHYTDPDRHTLETEGGIGWDGEPEITIRIAGQYATVPVRIPVDRIEELVAGLRDTARQAATQEQPEQWRRTGGFDQHDDYRETVP